VFVTCAAKRRRFCAAGKRGSLGRRVAGRGLVLVRCRTHRSNTEQHVVGDGASDRALRAPNGNALRMHLKQAEGVSLRHRRDNGSIRRTEPRVNPYAKTRDECETSNPAAWSAAIT